MSGVGIPAMLTEHGCDNFREDPTGANVQSQRTWKEVAVLDSLPMAATFSGGIAYTYGVRGGTDFSFYSGGTVSEFGFPGTTKTCGPGPNGSQTCNIQEYEKQIIAATQTKKLPTVADSDPATRTASNPVCKPYLDYDMSTPVTRQGADGYVLVQCPAAGTGKIPDNAGQGTIIDTTAPGSTNMGTTGGVPTQSNPSASASSTNTQLGSSTAVASGSSTAAQQGTSTGSSAPTTSQSVISSTATRTASSSTGGSSINPNNNNNADQVSSAEGVASMSAFALGAIVLVQLLL